MIVPVAVAVGGSVAVRVAVAVEVGPPGVFVLVAVPVAVGGVVAVADDVGDGATVFVAVFVAVSVWVGVLGTQVDGGAVTIMETLTRIVRALIPVIGSAGVSSALRRMKGTMRGTMGMKSP